MPTALIAEDEPLLAAELREELALLWPDLSVVEVVHDGRAALAAIGRHKPDVLFLDVQMPGLSGVEVARLQADAAQVVFVTAYDRFAIEAFDTGAADYLLKPLDRKRLAQALMRVRQRLAAPAPSAREAAAPDAPASASGPVSPSARMRWVTVLSGREIRFIDIDDVLCFEADHKYVTVVTAAGESLISTPLKELAAELDAEIFWQIHRGVIVNVRAIDAVRRTEAGKLEVVLKPTGKVLQVSDRYAHRFRQM